MMMSLAREKRLCNFVFGWFLILPATSWLLTYPRQATSDMLAEGVALVWGLLALGWSCWPRAK